MNLREEISKLKDEGYGEFDAQARICQDIILNAISKSRLTDNITIKGGVVMRNLSKNVRRATQDLDFDFIKKSISDDSIKRFVEEINTIQGITIGVIGPITELKQQDYKGKRVIISIKDEFGLALASKIDIGVHKDLDIIQDECCFDICFKNEGVSLLMNSKEQVLAEKLKSILKHDVLSTRYKDVFDICYLSNKINQKRLKTCISRYIFEDKKLNVSNKEEIVARLEKIFINKTYLRQIEKSKKNWLDLPLENVIQTTLDFIRALKI